MESEDKLQLHGVLRLNNERESQNKMLRFYERIPGNLFFKINIYQPAILIQNSKFI